MTSAAEAGTPRPFRFGVGGPLSATTRSDVVEHVRRAEDHGYSFASFPDHFFIAMSPLVAIGVAAAATTTLRLGTFLLANGLRNPSVLAKDLASLDVVSDGRLEVGLGAAWSVEDFDAAGLPYGRPGERIAMLAEAIEVLKGAWSGQPFDGPGPTYPVRGLVGKPLPAQPGGPPLLTGGGGRKILELAARRADIVTIMAQPVGGPDTGGGTQAERLAERIGWISAAEAGRTDPPERHILLGAVAVTDDRRAGAEACAAAIAAGPGPAGRKGPDPDDLLASPFSAIGSVGQICEHLRELRTTHGISAFSIGARGLEEMAPVVAELVGR